MIEPEIDQHFSAPPQRVFDAVTDHERIEEWRRGARDDREARCAAAERSGAMTRLARDLE